MSRSISRVTLALALAVAGGAALASCTGPTGPAGAPGAPGDDGAPGVDGADGVDGAPGEDRTLDPALAPIDKLFTALGGRDAVLALTQISVDADGTRFIAGEGFDPGDEPAAANAYSSTTSLDLAAGNARVDTTRELLFFFPGTQTYSEIARGSLGAVDGTEHAFGFPTGAMSADRTAAFQKLQLLLQPLALARLIADDETLVSDGGDALLGRLLQHVLVLDDDIAPVEIFVDAQSGEITRVATVENDWLHRDVELEVLYFDWQGAPAQPREVFLIKDGEILLAETREAVAAAPLAATLFDFPAGANPVDDGVLADRGARASVSQYALHSIGLPTTGIEPAPTPNVLAPGVVQLMGLSHHSLAVEQANGVVVVDAPLYDEKADAILGDLAGRFPGKAVTHVVASHFHEDHVSGIRTLLGNTGAALVVAEQTAAFWREILRSPSTIIPDAFAENPRTVTIIEVPAGGELTLADATLPVTLYNMDNGHADDLLFTHVSGAADVGFVVDVYSPGLSPFPFFGQLFVGGLVARGLDTPTLQIAGGHGGPAQTFAEVDAAVDAVSGP